MAAQNKTSSSNTRKKAADRAVKLNEKIVAHSRKASGAYLDAWDRAADRALDTYIKAASASKVRQIESVVVVQAGLTRNVSQAYTSAARELVAA